MLQQPAERRLAPYLIETQERRRFLDSVFLANQLIAKPLMRSASTGDDHHPPRRHMNKGHGEHLPRPFGTKLFNKESGVTNLTCNCSEIPTNVRLAVNREAGHRLTLFRGDNI